MNHSDLYQELIIDHGTNPRNYHALANAEQSEGYNSLCGDKIQLYLAIQQGCIRQASFEGVGCAISTASASLMTEYLVGKTLEEAQTLFQSFQKAMTSNTIFPTELGKLEAFAGVRVFPARIKCATLAWHALQLILKRQNLSISTPYE